MWYTKGQSPTTQTNSKELWSFCSQLGNHWQHWIMTDLLSQTMTSDAFLSLAQSSILWQNWLEVRAYGSKRLAQGETMLPFTSFVCLHKERLYCNPWYTAPSCCSLTANVSFWLCRIDVLSLAVFEIIEKEVIGQYAIELNSEFAWLELFYTCSKCLMIMLDHTAYVASMIWHANATLMNLLW